MRIRMRRFFWALPFVVTPLSCGNESQTEQVGKAVAALGGEITISGRVTDAAGLARPGVTVTLSGNVWSPIQTDENGNYSFSGLNPGSYSVRPTLNGCSFVPDVVNLNNLASSTVHDFGGSGPSCGGQPTVGSGATSGPLMIRGRITDASGRAIVGARVNLNGSAQALRFTDFTGGYVFHVSPGSYSLSTQADCALSPGNANLNNLNADAIQNFNATSAGCVTAESSHTVATGRVLTLTQGTTGLGTTFARVAQGSTSAGALARLQQIANEQPGPTRSLTIAGHPAIEREMLFRKARIVIEEGADGPEILALTTAIAIGSTVVRFESRLARDANATTVGRFFAAGRNFAVENISSLTAPVPPVLAVVQHVPAVPPPLPVAVAPSAVAQQVGEVSVAASDTANAMVIGTFSGPFYSLDAGQTVQPSAWSRVPPSGAAFFNNVGDPFTAVGAPDEGGNQTFYFTSLAAVTAGTPGGNPPTVAIGLFQSTDDGRTFAPASTPFPLNCNTSVLPTCVVPDQVQLAADRRNRAVSSGGATSDQLYMVWRHGYLPAGSTQIALDMAVACSADGGNTWNIDTTTLASAAGIGGDFGRITVAPDGSLWVAFAVFTPGTKNYQLQVQKFSSCAAGLQPQPGPVAVRNARNPANMAGMPRQPDANYSIAASEAAAAGNILFLAYATETTPGNENVFVIRSSDGGATWPDATIVNTTDAGHRYFPSICSTGSTAFISWYDRRAGTTPGASTDLTAYFRSSLLDNGARLGGEFNVSGDGFEDPQCLTGFPGGGSTTSAAELLCTNLPNVAFGTGQCHAACAPGATGPCGSLNPCDYRSSIPHTCLAGETCTVPGGAVRPGTPKYGDYNYTACARGRVFMSWATGTPPQGGCALSGLACNTAADCCSGNCTAGVCSASGAACSANGSSCSMNATCCSGSCQGGLCFATVGIYTASTSCTGDVPSDLTCGNQGLQVHLAGEDPFQTASAPFTLCGTGTGFTPGGQVALTLFHSTITSPQTHIVATADAAGAIAFTDTRSRVGDCTTDQLFEPVIAGISDQETGDTAAIEGLVPTCFLCATVNGIPPSCPFSFGGGCN
jgi:hypothetical protein